MLLVESRDVWPLVHKAFQDQVYKSVYIEIYEAFTRDVMPLDLSSMTGFEGTCV